MSLDKPNNRKRIILLAGLFLAIVGLYLTGYRWWPEKPGTEIGKQLPVIQDNVAVYFVKSKASQSVLEATTRPAPANSDSIQVAVKALLTGPSEDEKHEGFFSEIPAGTKLISVKHNPKAIRIDLSKEFSEGGGSNAMDMRLEQLVHTVTAIEKKVPIFLDINGKQLDILGGEGIQVNQPINKGSAS